MRFASPLIEGRLIRRYKRFLVDVKLAGGQLVTAHTANPGRMQGLMEPGSRVWLSYHDNPKRKLAYSWQLVKVGRYLVGVDPIRANALVAEAIRRGVISELSGYDSLRREVALGASRIDLLLERPGERCYVEVKSVTLRMPDGLGLFPDAVSERGRKHLLELASAVTNGDRAVLCFVVQRGDVQVVAPADHIDPAYGESLRAVVAAGVEVIAYRGRVRRHGIVLRDRLPVRQCAP